MKINIKKLERVIKDFVDDYKDNSHVIIGSKIVIGEINGAQIQLQITRSEDDMWTTGKTQHTCITK